MGIESAATQHEARFMRRSIVCAILWLAGVPAVVLGAWRILDAIEVVDVEISTPYSFRHDFSDPNAEPYDELHVVVHRVGRMTGVEPVRSISARVDRSELVVSQRGREGTYRVEPTLRILSSNAQGEPDGSGRTGEPDPSRRPRDKRTGRLWEVEARAFDASVVRDWFAAAGVEADKLGPGEVQYVYDNVLLLLDGQAPSQDPGPFMGPGWALYSQCSYTPFSRDVFIAAGILIGVIGLVLLIYAIVLRSREVQAEPE